MYISSNFWGKLESSNHHSGVSRNFQGGGWGENFRTPKSNENVPFLYSKCGCCALIFVAMTLFLVYNLTLHEHTICTTLVIHFIANPNQLLTVLMIMYSSDNCIIDINKAYYLQSYIPRAASQ